MKFTFGVAITTLNRRRCVNETLAEYRRWTPSDIPLLVVDDGSDVPFPGAHHRNATPQGVAVAKNACIALLMDAGCEYLLLSDDDCHPTGPEWWKPYVESEHPHVIHQPRITRLCQVCGTDQTTIYNTMAGRFECVVCSEWVRPVWEDGDYFSPRWAAGVLLGVRRDVIDKVGGMRPEFGRWSAETWEWSGRIQNVLGTKYPFIAPKDDLIHAVDAYSYGPRSSVSRDVRHAHADRNWQLFQSYKDSKDFVPYRLATVVVPWRSQPDRVAGRDRCNQFWREHGYTPIEADSDPLRPFLCAEARNNAARQASTEIVVIADADTIPDDISQIETAIRMVASGDANMCYPYTQFYHISESAAVMADYKQARVQKEYRDSPGGIFVTSKKFLDRVGWFDEHFIRGELSFDDTAFRYACETFGTVKRVAGVVWSFNHKTSADGQPDRDYSENNKNWPRFRLYQTARNQPALMKKLIGAGWTI